MRLHLFKLMPLNLAVLPRRTRRISICYQSIGVRLEDECLVLPGCIQPTDFSSCSSWLNAFPRKLLLLLLLSCQPVYAEEPIAQPSPRLTVENINKATAVMRDPALIAGKIRQGLDNVILATEDNAPPTSSGSINKGELKDPTLMNQNFRDALNRINQNNSGAVAPGAPAAPPALPKMVMLASVCGGQKNKNSAMLRINDKTEMVYIGDKISTLQNNELVEIQILDIHKHYVKVRVLPANETVILR